MAPKKAKGKKDGKGGKDGAFPEDSMSPEELYMHVCNLREQLTRERAERNLAQEEKVRILSFWEITKGQLETARDEIRNILATQEETEVRQRTEIKIYKEKVKHLMFEHERNIVAIRKEQEEEMKRADEEFRKANAVLRVSQRKLKAELKEQQVAHENLVKVIKKLQETSESNMRAEFERHYKDLEASYNVRLKAINEAMELKRKTEMHEIEERKNMHILQLTQRHEQAFDGLKDYFNSITLNNLSLINSLKDQSEDLMKEKTHLATSLRIVTAENRRMKDPLGKATAEMNECKKKLKGHNDLRMQFDNAKEVFKRDKAKLQDCLFQNEILSQELDLVRQEKDAILSKFLVALREVQQKCGYQNLILERRMNMLNEELEKRTVQLNELIKAAAKGPVDPNTLEPVFTELDAIVNSKNAMINELQYEVARVCRAHAELLGAYMSKLCELGVKVDETGFLALEMNPVSRKAMKGRRCHVGGPAGLVSKMV